MSVAQRNLDEDLVDELPPDFGITITGALPNTGETMNTVWILLDAKLQERAPWKTRATVRSVVSFLAGLLNAGVFLMVGAMSVGADPAPGLVLVGGALMLNAVLVWRWA